MSNRVIVSLSGDAWAIASDGSIRSLMIGDRLVDGETVVSGPGASVVLETGDGERMQISGPPLPEGLQDPSSLSQTKEPDDAADGERPIEASESEAREDEGTVDSDGFQPLSNEVPRIVIADRVPEPTEPVHYDFREFPSSPPELEFDTQQLVSVDSDPQPPAPEPPPPVPEPPPPVPVPEISVTLEDVNAGNLADAPISGTTRNVEPGRVVTLVISDGDPLTADVTVTAVVRADGSYATTADLSGLSDGTLTVIATVSNRAGLTATDTDTAILDTVPPSLEISSGEDTLAVGQTTTVTFTFTEAVTGFDATDILVTGGSIDPSTLTTIDNITWTISFTADGTDSITIGVDDDSYTDLVGNPGTGDSLPLNTAPEGVDVSLGAEDAQAFDFDASTLFSDADEDSLSFSVGGLPAGLTIDPNTGVISGTLDSSASQGGPGSDGVYAIVVTVADGEGGIGVATILLTVVNVPPEAEDDAGTTDEKTVLSVVADAGVLANDVSPDGDPLVVSAVNGVEGNVGDAIAGSSGGLVTINEDGSYSFNPNGEFDSLAAGETATTSVTYTVSDGEGGEDTATLTITVTGVNDPPLAVGSVPDQSGSDAATIEALNLAGFFQDPDANDVLGFSAEGLPAGLTIDPVTGVISGTLDSSASQGGPGGDGVYTVTVTATDPGGETATQTFVWAVVNVPPEAEDDAGTTDEKTVLSVVADAGVLANDVSPDGDPLVVSAVNDAAGNVGNAIAGSSGGLVTINEDGSYSFDPDGDFDFLGVGEETTTSVTYTVSDGEGGTDTATLTITVTGVNDLPVAVDDVDTTDEKTPLTRGADVGVLVNDSDPDASDTLVVSAVNGVEGNLGAVIVGDGGGRFTINADGSYSFDPNGEFDFLAVGEEATTSVTYTVSDVQGGTDTATLTITVTGVNDPPVATDDTGITPANTPVIIDVLANDTDPDLSDELVVSEINGFAITPGNVVSIPNGSVELLDDGRLRVTPDDGFDGALDFEYTLSDQQGGTDTAAVRVDVIGVGIIDNASPANPAEPDGVLASIDDLADTLITGRVPAGGTLDGLTITDGATVITVAPGGVTIGDDGRFSVTVDVTGLLDGELTVTLNASNSSGDSAATTATIVKDTATEVSIDPLNAVSGEIPEVTGTGEPGATITILVDGASLGTTIVDEDGNWSFIPGAPIPEDVFTIEAQAQDPWGNTASSERNVPSLTIPDDAVTVFEAGLPEGTEVGEQPVAAAGTFTLGSTDALATLSVGGAPITLEQLLNLAGTPVAIDTAYGQITMTGFDADTGLVNYTYSLTANTTDHSDEGNDSLFDEISVVVTDVDGDSRSGVLRAEVVDDVPVAEDLAPRSVTEGGVMISGNVITDGTPDRLGADGGRVHQVDYVNAGGESATVEIPEGGSATVATRYGELTVFSDGAWEYTSKPSADHEQPANDEELPDDFSYRLIDGDGDISNTAVQPILVLDTVPQIGEPQDQTVREANLATGTDPNPGAVTVTGSLNIIPGADALDTTFDAANVAALTDLNLTSGGVGLSYTLSADGYTLTASDGDGGPEVFSITITDPTSGAAGYEFQLLGPLDHDGDGTDIVLPFTFTVTDADGDSAASVFAVTVVDDRIDGAQEALVSEDGTVVVLTPADATLDNTEVNAQAQFGFATVNADGNITYVPDPNYSGPDSFTYRFNEGGVVREITVNVTVNPVADAPGFEIDANAITTDEDVSVALGLKVPTVTDDTRAEDAVADFPERLGPITLSGFPEGATLLHGSDGPFVFGDAGAVTILISEYQADGTHIAGATGDLVLTQAEFEALQVLPPEHDADNFTVTASVESFEVDADGNTLDEVDAAETVVEVAVTVLAVTDPVSLTFAEDVVPADFTIDEDDSINLATLLKADFEDLDGSEERWIVIRNPEGNAAVSVNGTLVEGGGEIRIDAPGFSTSTDGFPGILLGGGPDFSGDLAGLQVTLNAQDRDDDDPSHVPELQSSTVTLNLFVNPVPDEPLIDEVITDEDTPVAFLATLSTADEQGTETITAVTLQALPEGWVLSDEGVEVSGDGPFTIDVSRLADYTITPPPHSSLNAPLNVSVTVQDQQTVGGTPVTVTESFDIAIPVLVRPVAERVGVDSDGDGFPDLTITDGHTYTETAVGSEDEWFVINQGGFSLEDGWTNQDADGSEQTFALLTPMLATEGASQGNETGSSIRYSTDGGETWVTQVFNGVDPIEVPKDYLDTVQFRAAPNQAAVYDIRVQARTVDSDPDGLFDDSVAVSGEAFLRGIFIQPVASGPEAWTLGVNGRSTGDEDTPIALAIRPASLDVSETFEVTLKDIPEGSVLVYDGVELTANAEGNYVIADFDRNAPLTVQAPPDSNVDFTITVEAVVEDSFNGVTDRSDIKTQSIGVVVRGVADEPVITIAQPEFAEVDVDAADGRVSLGTILTQAELGDDDGSEVLSLRITGLDPQFSLEGATLLGGTGAGRIWVVNVPDGDDPLADVFVVVPENFSGTVEFQGVAITTENDGDSLTVPLGDLAFTVTPSPEATVVTATTLSEDTLGRVSFDIVYQNGDDDEFVSSIWISAADVEASAFELFLGASGSQTLADAVLSDDPNVVLDDGWYKLSNGAFNNVYAQGDPNIAGTFSFGIEYEITDPATDGTLDPVTERFSATYDLTVNAVTDPAEIAISSITSNNDFGNVVDNTATASGNVAFDVVVQVQKVPDPNGNNERDHDGSEQLLYFLIDGVPDGITIKDAVFIGETSGNDNTGQWRLEPVSIEFTGPIDQTIRFDLSGTAAQLEGFSGDLRITAVTQDTGPGAPSEVTASVGWQLTIADAFDDEFASGLEPSVIDVWEVAADPVEALEDVPINLGNLIQAGISEGTSETFSVTLTNLPEGTSVAGMTLTTVDGEPVWFASASGGNDAIQDLLNSISVTPPPHWNDNNQPDGFEFDATLTTFAPSGEQNIQSVIINQPITPVTDPAIVTIAASDTPEGEDAEFTVTLSNPADGEFSNVVDGSLYLAVNEAGMQGASGILLDSEGNLLDVVTVAGLDGIPDGSYYRVPDASIGDPLAFTYRPGEFASGEVELVAWVQTTETNAANTVASSGFASLAVLPENSGFDLQASDSTGDEDTLIQLDIGGEGLLDQDGSEKVLSAVLKNLPVGFLLLVGNDAGSATLATNAGLDAEGNNLWAIPVGPDGQLPSFIGVQPPAHYSGTIEGLELAVLSSETALDEVLESTATFDLTVVGVADGITLSPGLSFGAEGQKIALNLNATMIDVDGSETVTLRVSKLGPFAAFYTDGGGERLGWVYDEVSDTYTLTGITSEQINDLYVVQGRYDAEIELEAFTVEADGDISDSWEDTMPLLILANDPTPGDDTLLYTGIPLDGLDGDDVVQLRFGQTLDSDDYANLSNIEIIDLMPEGQDHALSNLTLADVIDMTDGRNALEIRGDSGDSVELVGAWTSEGNDGFTTYNKTVDDSSATVRVQNDVSVTVVEEPEGVAPGFAPFAFGFNEDGSEGFSDEAKTEDTSEDREENEAESAPDGDAADDAKEAGVVESGEGSSSADDEPEPEPEPEPAVVEAPRVEEIQPVPTIDQ